jgi:hypothetical protein
MILSNSLENTRIQSDVNRLDDAISDLDQKIQGVSNTTRELFSKERQALVELRSMIITDEKPLQKRKVVHFEGVSDPYSQVAFTYTPFRIFSGQEVDWSNLNESRVPVVGEKLRKRIMISNSLQLFVENLEKLEKFLEVVAERSFTIESEFVESVRMLREVALPRLERAFSLDSAQVIEQVVNQIDRKIASGTTNTLYSSALFLWRRFEKDRKPTREEFRPYVSEALSRKRIEKVLLSLDKFDPDLDSLEKVASRSVDRARYDYVMKEAMEIMEHINELAWKVDYLKSERECAELLKKYQDKYFDFLQLNYKTQNGEMRILHREVDAYLDDILVDELRVCAKLIRSLNTDFFEYAKTVINLLPFMQGFDEAIRKEINMLNEVLQSYITHSLTSGLSIELLPRILEIETKLNDYMSAFIFIDLDQYNFFKDQCDMGLMRAKVLIECLKGRVA